MSKRKYQNEGKNEDDITQNKFMAYLLKAFIGHKIRYLNKRDLIEHNESLTLEDQQYVQSDEFEKAVEEVHTCSDLMLQVENEDLQNLFTRLSEKELKIILLRVIFELIFVQIAEILNDSPASINNSFLYIKRKSKTKGKFKNKRY